LFKYSIFKVIVHEKGAKNRSLYSKGLFEPSYGDELGEKTHAHVKGNPTTLCTHVRRSSKVLAPYQRLWRVQSNESLIRNSYRLAGRFIAPM
jgi:hypothetical protein